MSIARVAARLIIGDLVEFYDVQEQIVRVLKGTAFSYRRQDMLRDVKQAMNWKKYRDAKKATGPLIGGFHKTFDRFDMVEGERYQIYGKSRWLDTVSNQIIETESSFYSDFLSDDDNLIQNQFGDIWAEEEEKYKGRRFIGFEVNEVWKNPDMTSNQIHRIR